MNILDMLSNEITNKRWTTEEKARYLYLRSCELFTYDPRYRICSILEDKKDLSQHILTRPIDIQNIKKNWVVCTTHQKYIFTKLLKELLSIESTIKKLNNTSIHVWSEFNDSKNVIKADTTVCSDLFRVKLGLKTLGYRPIISDKNFDKKLLEIDKNIGYINETYQDEFFQRKNIEYTKETKTYTNKDKIIIYKWHKILELIQKYQQENNNIDLHFCMQYLMLHLLNPEERQKITTTKLWQQHNNEWYFVHIYTLNILNETIYYSISRYQNYYQISKIEKKQAQILQNTMQKETDKNNNTLKLV